MVVRLRQPESSADIFLYLGHARAHDKEMEILLFVLLLKVFIQN